MKQAYFIPAKPEAGILDTNYAKGVSAQFGGILDGCLLMAGGCNFPDTPVADGGKKRYYDNIYLASLPKTEKDTLLHWTLAGRLPHASAYGVTIATEDLQSLILIGGTTADGSLNDVYRLSINENHLLIDTLPFLPATIDNMYGTRIGNRIFIVGGNVDGEPSAAVYSIDLNHLNKGWILETMIPGSPRVQPVCTAAKDELYIWGGFYLPKDANKAIVATDGYKYNLATKELSAVATPQDEDGIPLTLSGGIATTINEDFILCTGGVNKAIFEKALRGTYATEGFPYMRQPYEWYHFNDRLLMYQPSTDTWSIIGRYPQAARAGATFAADSPDYLYILGGELKPGIRSTENNRLHL